MEFRAPGAKGPPEKGPAGCVPWFDAPARRSEDHVIGIDTFGASGPGKTVYKEYGFTVDHIVDMVRKVK